LQRLLNTITNLAIIAVLVFLLVTTLQRRNRTNADTKTAEIEALAHRSFPEFAKLRARGDALAKGTAIAAMSSSCIFCAESGGFYRRLISAIDRKAPRGRIFFAFDLHDTKARQFLSKLGLPKDRYQAADFQSLGIRNTPTLLIIDEAGRVRSAWIGKLTQSEEDQILRSLAR